ncbi:MAG: SH3 domain-containing protein [Acidimicrobiia bacterium]|nr:SH3 domain-containing protein [Acidimicrobiia bacterium]
MTSRAQPIRAIAVAAVLALVASACGGDDSSDATETTAAPSVTTTTTAAVATTTTTVAPTTTTTVSTTLAGPTTTTLPGEPFDIGPSPGDVLSVVAVAFDDVLNLRAGPGTDFEVLKKMPPRYDRVIANGRAQALPNSIWYEVTALGVTGWASSTYLAELGSTDDITSQIVDKLGEIPTAETMADLGRIVAESYPAVERPLRVRMSGEPSVGDLGEVIYDVVGFADDSVRGLRLHVFGQPTESGDGFSLKSVEATALCARGVDGAGVCI